MTWKKKQLSIERLKLDNSDGEEGLSSDHIINGPHLGIILLYFFLYVNIWCVLTIKFKMHEIGCYVTISGVF